ncbi:hypothetical protein LGK97_13815 [Clostridium sp. CS001]|uniref:hypothetical protein n=1 Tax=Clostridium sp. CS001 TaxID=2880648 RepID=UPI001CF13EBD|nr:hypothetical protein [Clostridium sp. CS001]MCB2290818.1 hypothetical protein [Clostridium sp. CS001]
MQDCLKDFEKRMKKLSYPFLIDSQVISKREWEKYGLKLQQIINLVYTVLCLIMENSLKDEECTYKDINKFLLELLSQYYEINLSEEQIYELSKYIVMKVLRNEGAMFIFEAYDYENDSKKIYQYHLVKQENSKVDATKSTFNLTDEGYRLMLNSFEIDQKLKIEIESIIAEESIKRKNYKEGLMAVKNLDNLITAQIYSIETFILKAKENVLYIEAEEFNNSYTQNLSVIREQNKKFRSLKQMIINEKTKVERLIENHMEKEHMEALINLGNIEKGLQRIIEKATRLITRHMDFSEEYVNALDNLSYLYSNDKLDIKEKFLKPIEDDISRIDNMHFFLNSLFLKKISKKINLDKIFEEQKVDKKEDVGEGVIIDNFDYQEDDEEEKENALVQAKYVKIVRSILKYIDNNRNTELKNLIEDYEKKSYQEYIELVPSIRLFTEIMVEFIRIGEIDVSVFLKEYTQTYANDKIKSLDMRNVLYEVINNDNSLKNIEFIRFIKKNDEEIVEIKERCSEEINSLIQTMTAKCNNFLLQID